MFGLFRFTEYVDNVDLILKIQAHASQEGDRPNMKSLVRQIFSIM